MLGLDFGPFKQRSWHHLAVSVGIGFDRKEILKKASGGVDKDENEEEKGDEGEEGEGGAVEHVELKPLLLFLPSLTRQCEI